VTILLGLAVGSKLSADKFLTVETVGILVLGAAGVSAVPIAARVVNKVGRQAHYYNFLLMHAMGLM
jgi:oxaloacetate decarboxylase beta subunit